MLSVTVNIERKLAMEPLKKIINAWLTVLENYQPLYRLGLSKTVFVRKETREKVAEMDKRLTTVFNEAAERQSSMSEKLFPFIRLKECQEHALSILDTIGGKTHHDAYFTPHQSALIVISREEQLCGRYIEQHEISAKQALCSAIRIRLENNAVERILFVEEMLTNNHGYYSEEELGLTGQDLKPIYLETELSVDASYSNYAAMSNDISTHEKIADIVKDIVEKVDPNKSFLNFANSRVFVLRGPGNASYVDHGQELEKVRGYSVTAIRSDNLRLKNKIYVFFVMKYMDSRERFGNTIWKNQNVQSVFVFRNRKLSIETSVVPRYRVVSYYPAVGVIKVNTQ